MANDMPGGAAVGVSVAVVSSGSWMMAPPVAVMQVLMGAIMCCSCLWPVVLAENASIPFGRAPNSGAARQIYGSSALRPYELGVGGAAVATVTTPRSVLAFPPKSSTDRQRTERPLTHGRVVMEQPQSENKESYRTVINGRMTQPVSGSGFGGDLYGPRMLGERHGDLTSSIRGRGDRLGVHDVHGERMDVFVQHHEILEPDEALLDPSSYGSSDDVDAVKECRQTCMMTEFLCRRSCMCVPKFTRCDGEQNCEDGEDEEECTATSNEEALHAVRVDCEKSPGHTMCPRTFVCIAKDWLCDGDDDCGDFSDETHCGERASCAEDQFECLNGLCIQTTWTCDGDNDCKDFSDEMNCTKLTCSPKEFMCHDGNCISAAFKCDGDFDCMDETDEMNCELPMSNCPEGEFKCKSTVSGSSSGFGGKCILHRFRCDGDNDCGDWSDEEGCPSKMSSCSATEFKCGDGICIPAQWHCDREQDCDSGEDEENCERASVMGVGEARACTKDEFMCQDGRCIINTWRCDGVADCRKAEDETNCPSVCDVGQFSCPRDKNSTWMTICVHQKHICDGRNDCLNGEDELRCGTPRNCSSPTTCSQNCVTLDGHQQCACRVGFVLGQDRTSCVDIDECQFTHDPACSQECINTHGSFRCSCATGYILRPDLRTCKALGGAVKLIMANRADIRDVSLNSNSYNSIIKGLHNVIALDYHFRRQLLFWSDVSTDVIKMSFMNGTGIRSIVQWGLEAPGGISVDWVHDLLFWTDSGTRRVEVATFNGKLRAVVAANDLDKPRAIVVHPDEAFVFWTDWGNGLDSTNGPNPKIERSYMDGSERIVIIKDGVFWPNGLAIDYPAARIYWADAKHHVIESARFDGSERKKILSNGLPHPFALTIFEDLMIWTDWHTKKISAANKKTGKGFRNVHEGLNFPMDIHSYHASRQPEFGSRCKPDRSGLRGGCSHMCLPNRQGRRCSCPIGLSLKENLRTCTTVPDKLLLIARKKDIRIRQLNTPGNQAEVDMVVPLDGLKSTIAIDWCSQTDRIYWTDVGRSAISRANLNGSNQEHIITANLLSPAGLALDWVTQKLYWTDPGTLRIEVSDIDGKRRALLIWQRLSKPRDIVVEPLDGLMFWSDWGSTPVIERAGMDGSERRALVTHNLKFPNGLAVDQKNSLLYFVDGGTKSLDYVSFDGSGRKTVVQTGLVHPFGIDVFSNKVYWTDWDTQTIDVADKSTGKGRRSLLNNTSDLMDVRVFHRERKTIPNPCSVNNGGCSHLCLLNTKSYSCACPIGIRSKNNRVCYDGPSKYIVLAHRIDIRLISLDIDYSVDVILPFPAISNAVSIDVDLKTDDIYWSDSLEDTIMRSSPDGKEVRPIIRDSIDNVEGIAIDSVGRKLYWTDGGKHRIEVSDLDGTMRTVLVWKDLDSPRGIALAYTDGLMFWTDWGASPKLERSHMDGSKRVRIVTTSLYWPNGLAVDRHEKRVYWVDAHLKQMSSVDFDGNHRETLANDLAYPYGIAVAHHQVFFTDWNTTSLSVLSKNHPQDHETVLGGMMGLMDVKVIDKTDTLPEDTCGTNNGGCSHLCLRTPTGFSCKCPTGVSLMKGSTTKCNEMPDEYLLIALRSGIGRISLDTPELFDVVLPIDEVHGAVVLDYHYNLSKLFYADVNVDVIKVIDMTNMTDVRTIVASGLSTPNGLAVDWLANNLYWSDSVAKVIEVARLDGSCRKTIINKDLSDPRSLIVYPKRGYIFWADWGKPARIERSFMDGSGRKAIVDTSNGFPTGMAIDFETRKLYWADALEDRIDMCDFEGKKRAQVIPHATHPFGIALSGGFLYWTDWYNKSVFRAPMKGAKLGLEIRHGLRGALDMRSVSRQRQPSAANPCIRDNGGCSHLCLFRGPTYVCGCPDVADKRACRSELEHNVVIHSDDADYSDRSDGGLGTSGESSGGSDEIDGQTSRKIRIVIIATIVTCSLLVLVVTAILVLVCNSKRKRDRSPMGSTRSVLTFSNPNYNGADAAAAAALAASGGGDTSRTKIWQRRFKYDRSQDRVSIESDQVPRNLGTLPTVSTTSSSSQSSTTAVVMLPLATIG